MLAILLVALGCEAESTSPPLALRSTGIAKEELVVGKVARGNLRFVVGFEAGLREAAERRQPAMVYFSAEWGDYSRLMEGETFTNPELVELAQQFVCVLVDADREGDVCQQFRVTGYPTLQFLSSAGIHLGRIEGKQSDAAVLRVMQAALRAKERRLAEQGKRTMQ